MTILRLSPPSPHPIDSSYETYTICSIAIASTLPRPYQTLNFTTVRSSATRHSDLARLRPSNHNSFFLLSIGVPLMNGHVRILHFRIFLVAYSSSASFIHSGPLSRVCATSDCCENTSFDRRTSPLSRHELTAIPDKICQSAWQHPICRCSSLARTTNGCHGRVEASKPLPSHAIAATRTRLDRHTCPSMIQVTARQEG